MHQNQSYQQLSPHEVALIYRNSHALFKERALSLIQKEDLNAPNLERIQTQMVEFLVLCAQLNLNPYFFPGGNLSSHQLSNTIEQLKYMKNKEILLKPLEQEGLIQRDHNYLFMPPVFKDKSRIYFKINPLYSYKALLTQAINWMNSFLPLDEHLTLIEKEETAFVLKGNQLVRPVHFLLSILKQCEKLRGILNHNTDLTFVFEKVLSTLSPHDKYAKRLSYFLKHDTHFPPCRLDFILLRYLYTHKERPLYQELIDFERKIQSYQENLQEMSVRNEKNKSNEDFIDLIILSVRPHDIATMSTFTEWNTCMTAGSSFYMDIAKQIGAGSVIAYGVNSKNPYKRLARILLRPYVSAHTYKKLKHLEKLYSPEPNIKYQTYLFDSIQEDEVLESVSDVITDLDYPFYPERIYVPGKVYGNQSRDFSLIVGDIAKNMLDTPDTYGHMIIMKNMYLDGLDFSFYRYNPANQDNLKEYLATSDKNYSIDENGIIHISYLDLRNKNDLNLKNIHVEHLKITPGILAHPILENVKINALEIENASHYTIKELPSELQGLEEIVFFDDKKTFTLPQHIRAKRVVVKGMGAKSIPSDVQCEELNVSHTALSHLPENLNLRVLNASYCKNLDILPKRLSVSDSLDLSFTNISKVPVLTVKNLNLSGTSHLKKLPNHVKFKLLYMGNSALQELPENLEAEQIVLSGSHIKYLPKGLKAQSVSVDSTPLISISPDIQVPILDISETPIETLPKNLCFEELIATGCQSLKEIPDTTKITKSLNISNTNISRIPVLHLHELVAVRAKNLKTLPKGLTLSYLNANQSGLTKLPENFEAVSLMLSDTEIAQLPHGLKAERVLLTNTLSLTQIADSVQIGCLYAQNTGLKTLPSGLSFQKLFLEDCRFLSVIPDDLKVEHHLTLNNTAISYIPETGAKIVEAQNCPYLKQIHPNISCTELNLFESAIEELPDHLSLKKLTLSFSKIARLPHHLSVNTLTLFSTDIKALPSDLIADDIDLSQTPIDFIPENINIKKIKKLDGRPFCIHFTPHLKEVFMVIPSDELEIHPDFNLNVFAGLSLEIIENAKKRYQKQHLIKKPSLIQKNELYLSIKDGEHTHE